MVNYAGQEGEEEAMKDNNVLYETALKQFDTVAEMLNIEDGIRERMRYPKRSLIVSVPVKMDTGKAKVFKGYRVQHDITIGPSKGGIRYHPSVDLEEVSRPCHVDDMEMCTHAHAVWRRQRWRPMQS